MSVHPNASTALLSEQTHGLSEADQPGRFAGAVHNFIGNVVEGVAGVAETIGRGREAAAQTLGRLSTPDVHVPSFDAMPAPTRGRIGGLTALAIVGALAPAAAAGAKKTGGSGEKASTGNLWSRTNPHVGAWERAQTAACKPTLSVSTGGAKARHDSEPGVGTMSVIPNKKTQKETTVLKLNKNVRLCASEITTKDGKYVRLNPLRPAGSTKDGKRIYRWTDPMPRNAPGRHTTDHATQTVEAAYKIQ
jgi:hypothetical protein